MYNMKKILLSIVLFSGIACQSSKSAPEKLVPIYFTPEKKSWLIDHGFTIAAKDSGSVNKESTYYHENVNDTVIGFDYSDQDGQYAKQLRYNLKRFDTISLYGWFRTLDTAFNETSELLTVTDESKNKQVYQVLRNERVVILTYDNRKK
jgi:hypothetical protein